MSIEPAVVQTAQGAQALDRFLASQVDACIQLEPKLRDSSLPRVAKLDPLFVAIIEDAISIRLLLSDSRLNQAYVVARALLERATNYCFVQLCAEEQYQDYLDYTASKAARRLDRTIEAGGTTRARVYLKDGPLTLPPEIQAAVTKFTGQRGGEKTRWTAVSLPDRAAAIEAKLGNTGLFMCLLTVYADASEALHGTLYGALFHLGVYDVGSVPHDQATLDQHRYSTISALSLFMGGTLDTLFQTLSHIGEPSLGPAVKDSKVRFRKAAVEAGLTK